ncbi:type II secretion system F family protein [Adhaeretor mobilis]|uniref:Type II secretion system protein F n=1 Tax=Adhaeretor mobilis TaxID=1930276 RepID=A0A517MUT6_9BACT|nr:type II secretion system F family protein [Adhaeretor mobilis]QDS98629.1 Type II secretion system protein F [Adhaeretor mobilis]
MFSPRIHLKPLTALCHRLGTATSAGLEDQRIWRDESARGNSAQQRHVGMVADRLARNISLPEALRGTDDYFPPLFRQLVEVGEMTGRLDLTFKQLAQHYDRTLKAKREFWSAMAWPLLQLGMAAMVVGLLIWIMGFMPSGGPNSPRIDLLGFGLIGTRGLMIYLTFLTFVGAALILIFESARRGAVWTQALQRIALQVPAIGGALKTLALSRLTWALQLVFDTPMDLRKALPLALEATGNNHYAQHGPAIAESVQAGDDIATAFSKTGVFPPDFLDAIAVGEQSGMLAETMRRQAKEYREKAASAISILANVFGYAVWLVVAAVIILLIFRLFSFYVGAIQDASKI